MTHQKHRHTTFAAPTPHKVMDRVVVTATEEEIDKAQRLVALIAEQPRADRRALILLEFGIEVFGQLFSQLPEDVVQDTFNTFCGGIAKRACHLHDNPLFREAVK